MLQGYSQVRTFSATGADDDIVVSSVRAYVSAMNRLIAYVAKSQQRASQEQTIEDGMVAQQEASPVDSSNRDLTLA